MQRRALLVWVVSSQTKSCLVMHLRVSQSIHDRIDGGCIGYHRRTQCDQCSPKMLVLRTRALLVWRRGTHRVGAWDVFHVVLLVTLADAAWNFPLWMSVARDGFYERIEACLIEFITEHDPGVNLSVGQSARDAGLVQ